jgi:hypothetical protein
VIPIAKPFSFRYSNHLIEKMRRPYYKFEGAQQMYKNNIFPACIDNVKYNNATRPHVVKKATSGAIKKQTTLSTK